MFKKILIALALVIVIFAVVASLQSDEFRVMRSVTISASAADIFAQLNNQHKWQSWSPWSKLDPNATFLFEGPEQSVGSIVKWSGNNELGEGTSTIVESRPDEFIRFKLDFVRPMEASNIAEFTFKAEGAQTIVTWTMYGKKNFLSKAVGLLMNCEKMVGGQFEQGLASLKMIAEKK